MKRRRRKEPPPRVDGPEKRFALLLLEPGEGDWGRRTGVGSRPSEREAFYSAPCFLRLFVLVEDETRIACNSCVMLVAIRIWTKRRERGDALPRTHLER